MISDRLVQQARNRSGLLPLAELDSPARRSARRAGLVLVQPRVLAAATQPLDPAASVEAVSLSLSPPFAFLASTALWLHGVARPPAVVEVGVPSTRGLSVRPPVVGHRLAPDLMRGTVVRSGHPVVRLELAVVQAAAGLPPADLLRLVEDVVRQRRTTPGRLLAACGRGVAGSTAVCGALVELSGGDLDLHQRRLRRALEAAGVIGLESEVRFVSRSGVMCYVDLLHAASRRAFEVDGAVTHGTREQQLVDRRRDRWMLLEHSIATTRIAVVEVRDRLPELVQELLPLLLLRP